MSDKNSAKKKVLIADDSQFIRNNLKTILEKLNFDVVGMAENGLTVVSRYRELKPDIVTIDMVMPYLKGRERFSDDEGLFIGLSNLQTKADRDLPPCRANLSQLQEKGVVTNRIIIGRLQRTKLFEFSAGPSIPLN